MIDQTHFLSSGDCLGAKHKSRLPVFPVMLALALAAAASAQSRTERSSGPGAEFENHTVRAGDTLYSLARNSGTTVKDLRAANGLRSNRIRVGQVLRLPAATPAEAAAHNAGALADPDVETGVAALLEEFPEDSVAPPSLRRRLVEAATRLLGIRYRRSGASEKTGFDCSGLVQNVFRKFRIELPRSSREQYKRGMTVSKQELEPGDLVFFSPRKVPNHVAIYIGDNRILHALSGARKVVVSSLDKPYFKRRYLGARRMPELWEESALIADSTGQQ